MSAIDDDALNELAVRFSNRPERTSIGDKFAHLSDQELWSVVRLHAPALGVSEHERTFAQIHQNQPLRRRQQFSESSIPFLRDDICRLFEFHESILEAEALSKEFMQRLEPWGASRPRRIVWHFVEAPLAHIAYLGRPFDYARDALWESLEDYGLESVNSTSGHGRFTVSRRDVPRLVVKTLQADAGWDYAVENNVEVTGPAYAIPQAVSRRFVDLSNPFSKLIDLWRLGCFVFDVPQEADDTIKMYTYR